VAQKPSLSIAVRLLAVVGYAFLVLPMIVMVGASVTESQTIQFPPRGFSLRWYGAIFGDSDIVNGVILSAEVALGAALGAAILGTLGALFLARTSDRKRELFQSFFLAPVTMPHVLIGLAFLMTFSSFGLINTFGLCLAHIVICTPYVIRSVLSMLASSDPSLPRAAAVLGANPLKTFFHVILPGIRPAIASGAVFAFLVSFNNVSISMFVSSPRTATLPVVIFNRIDYVPNPSVVAVAALMILVTVVILLVLDRAFSLFRAMFG
jgi:putative spermidine/putrescine transport system permease protein